jgi:hypothetical protein
MNRFHKMLRSRTFWVFILVFVVNGLEGVRESIPKEYLPFINALLMGAGVYFRIYPNQQFPQPSPIPPSFRVQPPQVPVPALPPSSFLVQPPFSIPNTPFPVQPFGWPQPQPFFAPPPPVFTPPLSEPFSPAPTSLGGPVAPGISPDSDRDEKGGV